MEDVDILTELIFKTKNKEILKDLILGLTTRYERKILSRRIEIIKLLLRGDTQHEIADDLKIGVSTVTRGARELNLGRFRILR